MKAEAYWERRRQLEDKARAKMENETIKELSTDVLPNALKKIQEKLLSQSKLHNMTQNELLADFNKQDQKKYREYIDKNYLDLMQSDKSYQAFIDEFFPPYDYAKINQLTQIRADIFNILASEMIKTDVNQKFNDRLEKIVNSVYDSNSKALFQLLGAGTVQPLPKKELDEMLNYPWSGKTFSTRLWGNVSRLEQNLSQAIVNAVASGDGMAEVLKSMKGNQEIPSMFKLEESKFNRAIENLVRTEYAHFAVAGINQSLKDAGIKDKQSWSAEDERVCGVCGGRHGKLITDDWFPPYHGRCRCSLIPKMPELSDDIDKIYEEMFGDLLDEFAKDNFGITLTHPKASRKKEDKSTKSDIIKVKFNKAVQDGMTDEQAAALEGILNRAPESVRRLWNKQQDNLVTVSATSKKAYFSKGSGVYFNYERDAIRVQGDDSFSTFFHEFGHHIDSNYGYVGKKIQKFKSLLTKKWVVQEVDTWEYQSRALELSETLQKEYQGIKKQFKVKTLDELVVTMRKYANENYPYGYSGVSDILSGLTKDKYSLGWGHSKKYWQDQSDGLGKEAFANMFQAYVMQDDSHRFMKEVFPESYQKVIDFIEKEGV